MFLILLPLVLTACARPEGEDAWRVVQEQQQRQDEARAIESARASARAADKPGLMKTLIQQNFESQRYFAVLAYIDDYQRRFGNITGLEAMRAESLRQTGQVAESRLQFEALLSTDQQAQGLHGLGLLAGAEGDFAEAASYFSRAARQLPTDPDVLNDLAYARMQLGDVSGARVPMGQALELGQDKPRVIVNMALLLLLEGRPGEARQVMERAGIGDAAQVAVIDLAIRLREAAVQKERQVLPVAEIPPVAPIPSAVLVPAAASPMAVVVPVRVAVMERAPEQGVPASEAAGSEGQAQQAVAAVGGLEQGHATETGGGVLQRMLDRFQPQLR